MSDTDLVAASTVPEDLRQPALIEALGFDKLNIGQRELALAIARQYDLDPMLRHLVMVEGKPYITRDGLLHVAHKSGVFDGIEVDRPVLDDDGKYWRTTATVYRKDMSRPFRYPGRYPASGPERGAGAVNARFAEEMAIKVAEVMTLRRAFDVAAPVIEERWDGEIEVETPEQPATVTDKIAARAAQIEASMAGDPGPVAAELPRVLAEMEAAGDIALIDSEPEAATEPPDEVVETSTTPPPFEEAKADDLGVSFDDFKVAVKGVNKQVLVATAQRLFGERPGGFKELTDAERGRLLDELEAIDLEDGVADASGGSAASDAASLALMPAFVMPPETATRLGKTEVVLCGLQSPYEDNATCTMDKGHTGPHRSGVRVSW